MEKNILLRTNAFVCVVIIMGFIITSIISYHSNKGIFEQDTERMTALTCEGIKHEIDAAFTQPVNVSIAMANDNLLREFLLQERQRIDDPEYIRGMQAYLGSYREKYNYDSVFLISAETSRYYHYNGVDRTLVPDNPENMWYYEFLKNPSEYSLNIDNDEAAQEEITVFINCKITDKENKVMGVIGVGFCVNDLQDMLREYEDEFDVRALLLNKDGGIEVSATATGHQTMDYFAECAYSDLKADILSGQEKAKELWYSQNGEKGYIVVQYISKLGWFLLIDKDTSALNQKLSKQLLGGIAIIIGIILLVLFAITKVFRRYNAQIVRLTIAREHEHRTLFREATEKLYENIYEMDITHNRAASEATEQYFESLGVPANTPFDEALHIIAQRQIKEEYRQGYIETFSPDNVLKVFQSGKDSLCYDFKISNDGRNYYWMRITAKIFYWDSDQSVRMFIYRQNMDAEKRKESKLLEQMKQDSMSGLYNKAASQKQIRTLLQENPGRLYVFIMLDIDDFKQINDIYGHAAGDMVITDFSGRLRALFGPGELVGRIGGDEFVAFVSAPDKRWIQQKAEEMVNRLSYEFCKGSKKYKLSASIGIAIAPEHGEDFDTLYHKADAALYHTKANGKNGYTIYDSAENQGKM